MPRINEDADMSVCDASSSRSCGELDTALYAASRRSYRDSEGTSQASSRRTDRGGNTVMSNIANPQRRTSDCEGRRSQDERRDDYRYSETASYAPSQRSCRDWEGDSQASFQPRSRASSNAYACGSQQNSGNVLTDTPTTRVNAPPGGASSLCLGDADTKVDPDKLRMLKAGISRRRPEKAEVEGSRPRLHKPEIRVHAPPGGMSSISHDMTVEAARKIGNRKHFPEAGGAGNNRDAHAINELRYFQEDCGGVGKQHIQEKHLRASQRDCEHQRYHLDAGDNFERMPRRAQCKQDGDSKTWPTSCGSSQTTCLDSDGYGESQFDVQSAVSNEIDDLPLGAEWCTWQNGECGYAY